MNKNVLLIGLVVVVVGIAAIIYFSQPKNAAEVGDQTAATQQSDNTEGRTSNTGSLGGETSTNQNGNATNASGGEGAQTSETSNTNRMDDSQMTPCQATENTATMQENPIACVQTNMGTFEFVLYLDKTPITAQNFIDLADEGFYDGLIFHRIIDGFVIQGGDPLGNGTGGPGHTIPLEISPDLRHSAAGMVAMARSQDPDSAGSQWYVTLTALPSLDDQYAVFGKVIVGLDVVLAIGKVKTGDLDRPVNDVVMEKVTIVHPKSGESDLRDRDA